MKKVTQQTLCFLLSLTHLCMAQQKPIVLVAPIQSSEAIMPKVSLFNEACFKKISTYRSFAYVPPALLENFQKKEFTGSDSASTQTQLVEARKLLSKGKTKFVSADASSIRSAANDFDEARRLFLQQLPSLKSNRDLLDAHLYLGASLVALKKADAAQKAFEQVVYLNPDYEISPSDFSPSAVQAFAQAKQAVTEVENSRVSVESTPSQANIYINGKFFGLTPQKLNLKQGEYFFLLEKKGFETWYKPIRVERGVEFVSSTLKTSVAANSMGQAFAIREKGSDGNDDLLIRAANTTKADLVFMSQVEDKGSARLLSQWFDVKTGTFSQVALAEMGSFENIPDACLESIQTLAQQLDDQGNIITKPNLNYTANDLSIGGQQTQEAPPKQSTPTGSWYTKWWIYPLILGAGAGIYFGVKELGGTQGAKIKIDNSGNL